MKEYLNAAERSRFLILLCAKVNIEAFSKSNALTDEEKEALNEACAWMEEVEESLFTRLGEGFKKSMKNLAHENTIRVCGRWGETPDMTATIDTQELEKVLDECGNSCLFCTKCEYKSCPVFQIKQYFGFEGICEEGCPYRLGEVDL